MGCLLLRVPGPHTNRVVWKDYLEKAATGAISLRCIRPCSWTVSYTKVSKVQSGLIGINEKWQWSSSEEELIDLSTIKRRQTLVWLVYSIVIWLVSEESWIKSRPGVKCQSSLVHITVTVIWELFVAHWRPLKFNLYIHSMFPSASVFIQTIEIRWILVNRFVTYQTIIEALKIKNIVNIIYNTLC